MKKSSFPLVSDEEVMLNRMPLMNLYDENDLISNITGEYADKNYLDWQPIVSDKLNQPQREVEQKQGQSSLSRETNKSYAELAREEARADLKKKRSAAYLTKDIASKKRGGHSFSSSHAQVHQPTAFFQKEKAGEYAKYARRLQQTHYILAETLEGIEQKTEQSTKQQKNTYDFLKNSQIYNAKSATQQKERRIQEVNLTNLSTKE